MNPIRPDNQDTREELAERVDDQIDVRLLWARGDGSLVVAVSDDRTGDAFEVPVGDSPALDVFHHPYAYAAARGIEYHADVPRPPEEDESEQQPHVGRAA